MLPVPLLLGVQSIVAFEALTVIVSVPAPKAVCDALTELMLPLNACAWASCGPFTAAARASVAHDSNNVPRLIETRCERGYATVTIEVIGSSMAKAGS